MGQVPLAQKVLTLLLSFPSGLSELLEEMGSLVDLSCLLTAVMGTLLPEPPSLSLVSRTGSGEVWFVSLGAALLLGWSFEQFALYKPPA